MYLTVIFLMEKKRQNETKGHGLDSSGLVNLSPGAMAPKGGVAAG
jgi:hypothetical protein